MTKARKKTMTGDGNMIPEIHDFWITHGEGPENRLELMAELREYVDGLPQTRQTFRLSDAGDFSRPSVNESMMWMLGAWRLPEIFVQGHDTGERWINPRYKDKHLYPASWARCACGAVISRGYFDGGNSFRNEHEHNEDCSVPDRLRARADMLEERKRILIRGLEHGLSGRELSAQIGIRAKGLGQIANSLNVSIRDVKNEFRRVAGNTYAEFRLAGVDADLIAEAYGYHPDSLARYATKYSDYEYNHDHQHWERPYDKEKVGDITKRGRSGVNRGVSDD